MARCHPSLPDEVAARQGRLVPRLLVVAARAHSPFLLSCHGLRLHGLEQLLVCHLPQVLVAAVVEGVEVEVHQQCLPRLQWHQRLLGEPVPECLLEVACLASVDLVAARASPMLLAKRSQTCQALAEDTVVLPAAMASQAWPAVEEVLLTEVLVARLGNRHNSLGRGISLLPFPVRGFNSRLRHSSYTASSLQVLSLRC